jgi:phytanoyl-CoA hydroxylase
MSSVNLYFKALFDLDPVFNRFTKLDKNVDLVKHVLGMQDPLMAQSMYIFKQPKIGGHVSIHQDNTFINTKPLSTAALWFALDDVTLENGCLWV